MSEKSDTYERKEFVNALKQRKIDNEIPPLRQYLKPGLSVLDVGCEPGTVTIDAAGAVQPASRPGKIAAGAGRVDYRHSRRSLANPV